MIFYDFSKYEKSNKLYGGTEKKVGILINNVHYMLKFQKNTPFGYRNNTISEYLGSHIFSLIGLDCQETYLGQYDGKLVVACKDFVDENCQFVPFNDVGESSIEEDRESYQYSYSDIIDLLKANKKLTNVDNTISNFFDIYIVDALIGNFDRHGGNWGFIKRNGCYSLAPVFDNGSCMYPSMIDEDEMKNIIGNQEEIKKRIYQFPTSQIKHNGKKSSYYDVISSLQYKEINKAIMRIVPKIDINEIFILIDKINCISLIHKNFYKIMIKNRYEKILLETYEKLMEGENENI